jgi:cytochrome oxidase assembly protein ShyY1
MKDKKMIWIGVAVMAIVVYYVFFRNKKIPTQQTRNKQA